MILIMNNIYSELSDCDRILVKKVITIYNNLTIICCCFYVVVGTKWGYVNY